MRLWVAAALVALGCVAPPQTGDRLYAAGDLRGAVTAWRAADDATYSERIAEVEAEIAERAAGYVDRASGLESQGRVAESILDYRLSLTLLPDDTETLAHVQQLARDLVARRAALEASYQRVRSAGDLEAAGIALEELRRLDPFEPEYETEERRLAAAIAAEWQRRRAEIRIRQAARVESLIEDGRAAFGEEELETALDLWRQALLIDPENERVQAYIARAEQQLEELQRLREGPEPVEDSRS